MDPLAVYFLHGGRIQLLKEGLLAASAQLVDDQLLEVQVQVNQAVVGCRRN